MDVVRLMTSAAPLPFVHIMAHRMGKRALLRGIARLYEAQAKFSLSQVILAAPDVSQGLFRQMCGAYVKHGARCTLYASKHDRALMGSRLFHARGRVGYIPPVMVIDGIDTVRHFSYWLSPLEFEPCRIR